MNEMLLMLRLAPCRTYLPIFYASCHKASVHVSVELKVVKFRQLSGKLKGHVQLAHAPVQFDQNAKSKI